MRVFNHRGVNAAPGGSSAQPVFGGPVYFFRNALYYIPSGVAFTFSAKPACLFVGQTITGEHLLSYLMKSPDNALDARSSRAEYWLK